LAFFPIKSEERGLHNSPAAKFKQNPQPETVIYHHWYFSAMVLNALCWKFHLDLSRIRRYVWFIKRVKKQKV